MAFKSEDIAAWFLEKAALTGQKNGLTHMKLHKLIYLAHGWYAAHTNERLVGEEAQAWEWGPVFPSLYFRYRIFGKQPLPKPNHSPRISDPVALAVLQSVWNNYSKFSAAQLSDMTHKPGTPWWKAWHERGGNSVRGTVVAFEDIQQYFADLQREAQEAVERKDG